MSDFPLLSLHPLADARHRWVGTLIEAHGGDAESVSAACVRWLDELGLREALGGLPLVWPALDAAALAGLETLPSEPPLRLRSPATAEAIAALAARCKTLPGSAVLAEAADPLPTLPTGAAGWLGTRADLPAPAGGAGPHILLRVGTQAQATAARAAGWSWLGGNYAHEPAPASARQSSGRSVMLKLLSQVTADADDAEIEKTLKQDPNLSFQLLRLVNSAGMSGRAQVTSFRQAIQTLGRRQLQRWLQLLLYAQQGDSHGNPLLPVAAWRAGLMEALAIALGRDRNAQDAAFMAGMFSRLDALFGQPLGEILGPLSLEATITEGLLQGTGPIGGLLAVVTATEAVMTDAPEASPGLASTLAALPLAGDDWAKAQARAMGWALQICREL